MATTVGVRKRRLRYQTRKLKDAVAQHGARWTREAEASAEDLVFLVVAATELNDGTPPTWNEVATWAGWEHWTERHCKIAYLVRLGWFQSTREPRSLRMGPRAEAMLKRRP